MSKIPDFMRTAMLATCETIMASRLPDVVIGNDDNPYVHRWWLGPHGKEPSAYIHKFLRSDYDGALHDHRYRNVSVILKGQCNEYFHEHPLRVVDGLYATVSLLRTAGEVIEREAATPHRIELIDNHPMTTIFFTGAHERDWGFHPVEGWLGWKEFNDRYGDARPNGNYGAAGI